MLAPFLFLVPLLNSQYLTWSFISSPCRACGFLAGDICDFHRNDGTQLKYAFLLRTGLRTYCEPEVRTLMRTVR